MGKKKSKSKSTSTPWGPAQPYLLGAASTIQNTVNANQGNLDEMAGNIRGFLPGLGEKAFGNSPLMGAASQYATDVLGGKYLGQNNPYLNDIAGLARNNVAGDINSQWSKAGRVGGDGWRQALSKGMGEAELGLRYNDYANERNAMGQMAGMAPGIEAGQYAGIAPYLAASQTAAGLPFTGINNLGMMGGLFGGYGKTTQTQPGGWGTALLGAGAAALPYALSERAAKTKIERIGDWDEKGDIGRYRFAYKHAPNTMLEGVMADEVAEHRPWAIGPTLSNGWRTVNYAALEAA